MFYPNVKDGMSPSALASWLQSRSSFVRTYFANEEGVKTAAMDAGTKIHALIEAGIMPAKHVYAINEQEIRVEVVPGSDFVFRGVPDSRENFKVTSHGPKSVSFVDYKSGKANGWEEKLPTDIKMRATAWLVWKACKEPETVTGYIEFIQTTWDPTLKQVVAIDGKETEIVKRIYTAKELGEFTNIIIAAMHNVNAYYEKWQASTGDFVNDDDVHLFIEKKKEIARLEAEADDIAERIQAQMEFGGEENHRTVAGTFYFKTTKTYETPKDLEFEVDGRKMTLADADQVIAAAKAARGNYELATEPKEIKTTLAFRPSR